MCSGVSISTSVSSGAVAEASGEGAIAQAILARWFRFGSLARKVRVVHRARRIELDPADDSFARDRETRRKRLLFLRGGHARLVMDEEAASDESSKEEDVALDRAAVRPDRDPHARVEGLGADRALVLDRGE